MPLTNEEIQAQLKDQDKGIGELTKAIFRISEAIEAQKETNKQNHEIFKSMQKTAEDFFKKTYELELQLNKHLEAKENTLKRIEKIEATHQCEKGCQATSLLIEKISVANNRIKDLEDASEKTDDNYKKITEKVGTGVILLLLSIIGSLATLVASFVIK